MKEGVITKKHGGKFIVSYDGDRGIKNVSVSNLSSAKTYLRNKNVKRAYFLDKNKWSNINLGKHGTARKRSSSSSNSDPFGFNMDWGI